jgi:hypothetical protein
MMLGQEQNAGKYSSCAFMASHDTATMIPSSNNILFLQQFHRKILLIRAVVRKMGKPPAMVPMILVESVSSPTGSPSRQAILT